MSTIIVNARAIFLGAIKTINIASNTETGTAKIIASSAFKNDP